MIASTLRFEAPMLKDTKMLMFVHEKSEGFSVYPVVVPADYSAPEGTVGGPCPVDEVPELWAKYQVFVALLDIPFDETDDSDFLWCQEELTEDIPVLSADDLR